MRLTWFTVDSFLHGNGSFLPLPRRLRRWVCYKLDRECGWEGTFADFEAGR